MTWSLIVGGENVTGYVTSALFNENASSSDGSGTFTLNGAPMGLSVGASVLLQNSDDALWEGTVASVIVQKDTDGSTRASLVTAAPLAAQTQVAVATGSTANNDVAQLAANVCAQTPLSWGGPTSLGVIVGGLSFTRADDALTTLAHLAVASWRVQNGAITFIAGNAAQVSIPAVLTGTPVPHSAISVLGGADQSTRVPLALTTDTTGPVTASVGHASFPEIADQYTLQILANSLAQRYGSNFCATAEVTGVTVRAGDIVLDSANEIATVSSVRHILRAGLIETTITTGLPTLSTTPVYSQGLADQLHRFPVSRVSGDYVVSGGNLVIEGLAATIDAVNIVLANVTASIGATTLTLPENGTVQLLATATAVDWTTSLTAPLPGQAVALYRLTIVNGTVVAQSDLRSHGGVGGNNLKPPTTGSPVVTLNSSSVQPEGPVSAYFSFDATINEMTFDDTIASIDVSYTTGGVDVSTVHPWAPAVFAPTSGDVQAVVHGLAAGNGAGYDVYLQPRGQNGTPLGSPLLLGTSPSVPASEIELAFGIADFANDLPAPTVSSSTLSNGDTSTTLVADVLAAVSVTNVPQDGAASGLAYWFRVHGQTTWIPYGEQNLDGLPTPSASQTLASFAYGQLTNGIAYDFAVGYVGPAGFGALTQIGSSDQIANGYTAAAIVVTTPYLIGTTSPTPTVTSVTTTAQASGNGLAAAMRLQFTLTNQPTDGSLSRLSVWFRVHGATAWTFYTSIGVPGLPTPSESQAYDITLADLTNGQSYDFACSFENAQGQDSATFGVIASNVAAVEISLPASTLQSMPATGSPSRATAPTLTSVSVGSVTSSGSGTPQIPLSWSVDDWTSGNAPDWIGQWIAYYRTHGTSVARPVANGSIGSQISFANVMLPLVVGESGDYGLAYTDATNSNTTPITWPSAWSNLGAQTLQNTALSVMPATGSPSIATAPTLSSVSAGTPYTLGGANAYVELEWTLADWTAGNAPGWVGMGHLVKRPNGGTQVSLAGTFVVGETVALTQYVAYPAGEATDFGLQLSDIGAANQTPIVWPSAWENIAAQTMSAANAKYSTGSTVEAMRPEEAGANVTETRTAKDVLYGSGKAVLEHGAQVFSGKPLDTLVDSAGYKLMRYGTLAARPAASTAGRLYHAEDAGTNGITYRDTGSAWVEIGVGHLADIGGTTDNVTEGTNKFAAEHGADVTIDHTAAAITGQGALATKSNVGNADLSGVTLAAVGDTSSRFAAVEANANNTESRYATGVGTGATQRTATQIGSVVNTDDSVTGSFLQPGIINLAHLNGGDPYGDTALIDSGGESFLHGVMSAAVQGIIDSSTTLDVSKARTGKIMPLANHAAQVTGVVNADGSTNVASKNLLPNADLSISGSAAASPNTGTLPKFWTAYNNAGVNFAFAHDATATPPVGSGAWKVTNNSGSTTTNTMGLCCGFSNIDGSQNQLLYAGKTYVVSWYAKASTANLIFYTAANAGIASIANLPGFPSQYNDTGWHRYAQLWTVGSSNYQGGIFFNADTVGNGNSLWFAGVQLEEGSVPSAWSGPSVPASLTQVFDLPGNVKASTPFVKYVPNMITNMLSDVAVQFSVASGSISYWMTNNAGSGLPTWIPPDGSAAITPSSGACGSSGAPIQTFTGLSTTTGYTLIIYYNQAIDTFEAQCTPTASITNAQIAACLSDGSLYVVSASASNTFSTVPSGPGIGHYTAGGGHQRL